MRKIIFITGVSGCGKTTIAHLLSDQAGIPFIDGDDYHSIENVKKMESGVALNDQDRASWLERLNKEALNANQLIIACSALKERYRIQLSKGLATEEFYFIHLQGSFELISERINKREAHFMPSGLLKSQFDSYESPSTGYPFDVSRSKEIIVNQILEVVKEQSEFGIIGLGVMGTSLARNIAGKGYRLSIFNRHLKDKEVDIAIAKKAEYKELSLAKPYDDLAQFVQSIATPRSIMLMVNAGQAVDYVMEALIPLLQKGDLIIDGGNSHYDDTQRRFEALKKRGIHFLGCGVSGGEQGALLGPSIMPGGAKDAYPMVQKILEDISADAPLGGRCCAFIGAGGAGHFVKMVHNGIEYGEMQLIAEAYTIMRYGMGYGTDQIADTFKLWSSEACASYLLEITINILQEKDSQGQLILDQILDKAGNKGTGSWTSIAAAQLGVPIPTLTAALYARYQSSYKDQRVKTASYYPEANKMIDINAARLRALYQFSRIMNHHQGIQLIKEASDTYSWDINFDDLLKVWSAGCIIRSELLAEIRAAKRVDFMHHEYFTTYINKEIDGIIKCKSTITEAGIATPCLSASLDYYLTLTKAETNANMIQAQRDYFGAHTFKWKHDPEGASAHHVWE